MEILIMKLVKTSIALTCTSLFASAAVATELETPKPTVLVHGAFADGSNLNKVILRDGVPFRLTMSLTPTLCARELAQALVTMRATLESTTDAYLKRPEFSTFSPPTNGLRLTWPIFLESTIEASRAGIRCQCRGMANCFFYRCLQVCSSDNDDCGEM